MAKEKNNNTDENNNENVNIKNDYDKNIENGIKAHNDFVNSLKPEYVLLAEKHNKGLPNINNDFKLIF